MRFPSSHLILCAICGISSILINVFVYNSSFVRLFPSHQNGAVELLRPTRLAATHESASGSAQRSDELSHSVQNPAERRRIRRRTASDRSRTPYADASSVGLVLRLKALKKQLTQALQAPIAAVPAASSATALVSTNAGGARVLGRAPADDASAGPWEYPGEPGLYSALKHSLGQVGLPYLFACCILKTKYS
jgi:hypothetical protein